MRTLDLATLTLTDGAPSTLHWAGRDWTVIDTPTRLGPAAGIDPPWHAVTHPPADWTGWRFTARAGDTVRVIDLREAGTD